MVVVVGQMPRLLGEWEDGAAAQQRAKVRGNTPVLLGATSPYLPRTAPPLGTTALTWYRTWPQALEALATADGLVVAPSSLIVAQYNLGFASSRALPEVMLVLDEHPWLSGEAES